MTRDERRDQLLFYAAGQLDPAEEAALRAELSHATPEELGAVAEGHALVAQLLMSLPPVVPSAQARERLMQNLSASDKAGSSSRSFWWPLLTAIAAGVAIGLGIIWFNDRMMHRERVLALQQIAARLDSDRQSAVADNLSLTAQNAALRHSAEFLHAENVKLVSLSAKDSSAVANVFWDRSHGQWTVSVFKLKPLSPEQVYELWFIPKDGKPIAAGDLSVDASGDGVTTINVPSNLALAAAGITTEIRGAAHLAPTPPIHLSGAVQ